MNGELTIKCKSYLALKGVYRKFTYCFANNGEFVGKEFLFSGFKDLFFQGLL